jgi:hypothetical protein
MTNDLMTNNPMTTPHRYQLQPYKTGNSRYTCPQCQQPHTFTRYIDTETNLHLNDAVGRCSREHNCGYHYTPKQFFGNHREAGVVNEYQPVDTAVKYPDLGPSLIPVSYVNQSLSNYAGNNLVTYLCRLFGDEAVHWLISLYHVGTGNHWPGASIFWQMDAQGKVRTGKIMLYNAHTGKRVKQPYNHIQWVHTKLYAGYYLQQCLFGEHLLNTHPDKPVAVVESEKTALIAALHLPQYLWLATGGLHNLNPAKCQVLKGRKVILYPDVNAYTQWQQKANDLQLLLPGTLITISNYLELNATDIQRKEGWDFGDYLVG